MTQAEVNKMVGETATKIFEHAMYQAKRNDCDDVAESVADQVIDLLEWMAPSPDFHKQIALRIVETYDMPMGAKAIVRQHFDLPY